MLLISVIGFVAVVLTATMFATKQSMLGFPCVIFWAIMGGEAFTQSEATWDTYYLLFFACTLGMATFCALGAWGLREPRDTIADEGLDEDAEDADKEDDLFSIESDESRERKSK